MLTMVYFVETEGVVCPLDGMTNPCSYSDLPTPYEPIVNLKGMPAFEYEFPAELRPPLFSMDECLALNSNSERSASRQFFFGELIPPYIDVLGRGPHFRPSDQRHVKYQNEAKCYRNSQPNGSLLYKRMADYYGPQFDIQTGYSHQGYGTSALSNQIYATAPPPGYDFSLRYGYFRGKGSGYIDLPKARVFDPSFNCTRGMKLMNSSLVKEDVKRVVYTDAVNDYEGGYDIEKCQTFDQKLNCYVDNNYEVHAKGDCCDVNKFVQRAIFLADDQFYEGTCEADRICAEGRLAAPEAKVCDDGYVCDEGTTLDASMDYPCPAGFVCDFATTPDTKLIAAASQLSRLCPEGYYCDEGTGSKDKFIPCPKDYFCPTGTADPYVGRLANDGLLRNVVNSPSSQINIRYQDEDRFALLRAHDAGCKEATQHSLEKRFRELKFDFVNTNYLEYHADQNTATVIVNEATESKEQCARDNKAVFITDAMRRNECNCRSQFYVIAVVYRLWKCTSDEPLDSLSPSRDFWYPNSRVHLDYGASMELLGLRYGDGKMCHFSESNTTSLTTGRIPPSNDVPNESNGFTDFDSDDVSFHIRFTHSEDRVFDSYRQLKVDVVEEYVSERKQVAVGNRSNIDPFIFDLYNSIQLIEQHGRILEDMILLEDTDLATPSSLDWCSCQGLLKCPNGTITFREGTTRLEECFSTKQEVLSRITLIPPPSNTSYTASSIYSTKEGHVDESMTLTLDPFEVAILTIDQSRLPTNLTYGEHYRIAIYDGCKPCPLRYQCEPTFLEDDRSPSCKYPLEERQMDLLNQCLKEHRREVCLDANGLQTDVEDCNTSSDVGFLLFTEPDIDKCLSRPYFCSDSGWNYRSFRRLCQDTLEDGKVSPIYDCADVRRWQIYVQWRDEICCSPELHVPELSGIASCNKNAVCTDDPLIEDIVREKLMSVFEAEHGFTPPTEQPLGQLLMNKSMQEDRDNDAPLSLFNEWQGSSQAQSDTPHNRFKPELSEPWVTAKGCCRCQRHSMPHFFETNAYTSGFPDDKHHPIQITISALARVELTIVVELLHGTFYSDFEDYFALVDKSMLKVHSPSRFDEDPTQATWLTILEQSTFDKLNLDLPLNLPTTTRVSGGDNEIETRFLVDRPSNFSIGDWKFAVTHLNGSNTDYSSHLVLPSPRDPVASVREEVDWWAHDFFALPYIPFFSNCDGYDSHISWSRLLEEHPDCLSVSYDQTVPTKEYSFQRSSPLSDECIGVTLQCTYEEDLTGARQHLRWFEISSGSTLFFMTRDAVSTDAFVPSKSSEGWGRTDLLNQLRNSYDVIPVSVDKDMGGYRHTIPRHVELEVKYFQESKGNKRLVEVSLYYEDLCTTQKPEQFGGNANILSTMKERGIVPCEVDVEGNIKSHQYNLEVHYFSLGWFDLLNRFEFRVSVYFFFFTIIGLAIYSLGGIVYGTNRLLTKLRHPPKFPGMALIKLVTKPQLEGCALALIPYMAAIMIIYSLFGGSGSTFRLETIHRGWTRGGVLSDKEKLENSMGRVGSAMLVLGVWLVMRGVKQLIPDKPLADNPEKRAISSGSSVAKRAHFLWIGFCIQAMLMCALEFSYSDIFKKDIYRYIVLFRICSLGVDVFLSFAIKEKLLTAPLLVLIQMTELLITIGARDFVEFTLSFLVKVTLMVVQRLFLYPMMKTISTLWPRWKMLAAQAFGSRGLTRQQTKEREAMWRKVNEDIELRTEGVEPLLDSISIYSIEKTGSILVPFMCLLLMLIYRETEIAMNYNINQHELLYYGIFALYMIPWMSLVDAFIMSSQELLYGWRVYDYFSYTRWRFAHREQRWNLLSQVDESVTKSLQTIDLMCFSSQYYFILTMLTLGFGTNMIGVTICLRRSYNLLSDPAFSIIVVIVVLCCEFISLVCFYISNATVDVLSWDGVWKVVQLRGTMDDVIAAKLAIGEGRQEDLELERQEILAMNNESFRHKFIEKNRPWVLQHLVELITPRILQDEQVGPDGRPLVDYVRDVYSNLMTVGEGIKRSGDRSDISDDDSSDDEFDQRRKWDRTPLEGSRLKIAQVWLQKARKRRVLTKTVMGIIEKRKEDHCLQCSRTLSSCSILTAGLASDGKYDPYAIEAVLSSFEEKYSSGESDPNLWKAFFRENAEFTTVCNICLDQMEKQKLHKNARHVGAGRPTRPGDISSDDESEDVLHFDPLVVARSSKEGRMLDKWLQASRERLGGNFPRRDSQRQTELYLERIKIRTMPNEEYPIDNVGDEQQWGSITLDVSGTTMLKRWLNEAKSSSVTRYEEKANAIRKELQCINSRVSVEDDWHFGQELRLEGVALKMEGDQIANDKLAQEAKMTKYLDVLREDSEFSVNDARRRKQSKSDEMDDSLANAQRRVKQKKEERTLELNRALDQCPSEEESLRTLLANEMYQEDEKLAEVEENIRRQAESYIKAIDREIRTLQQKHRIDAQSITERSRKEYVFVENAWRKKTALWIGKASRKLEAKKASLAESMSSVGAERDGYQGQEGEQFKSIS